METVKTIPRQPTGRADLWQRLFGHAAWNTFDMDPSREEAFWAIDVMTAWSEASDSTDFAMSRAEQYLAEPDGGSRLRKGLISLAGLLLLRVAQESGSDTATPDELRAILQDIARRLAQ